MARGPPVRSAARSASRRHTRRRALAALGLLARLRAETGSLDRVRRIVKLTGFVNAAPDFESQPQVINGASDLLVEVFGEAGRHARSAIGVGSLPFNAPVEVELVAEIEA
jgi:enamine deaminase RidA (YjgF/YER057c/UK114 family)